MGDMKRSAWMMLVVSMLVGCGREKIEAIELANEASKMKQTGSLDGAIQKYEAAIQLDPSNHEIMFMLAMTYKKREEWEKTASMLARATGIAPTYGSYWYERGLALVQIAEKSKQKSAWEEARDPLVKCTEVDRNFAHCYMELGKVELYLDNEEAALRNFTSAITHAPDQISFYAPLADLYMRLNYFDKARGVLEEGLRVAGEQDTSQAAFNLYQLLSGVHMATGDGASRLKVLEDANRIAGKEHPEILFNLGSAYADLGKNTQALQMLKKFQKQSCAGGKGMKFKDECAQVMDRIAKLQAP